MLILLMLTLLKNLLGTLEPKSPCLPNRDILGLIPEIEHAGMSLSVDRQTPLMSKTPRVDDHQIAVLVLSCKRSRKKFPTRTWLPL